MRSAGFIGVIICIMVLLDLYVFQAVKMVSHNGSSKMKMILYSSYWVVSGLSLIIVIIIPFIHLNLLNKGFRNYVFFTLIGLYFAKLIAATFFLVDDVRRLIQWASSKLFFRNTEGEGDGDAISRSVFLSWLGLGAGSALFVSLVHGFSNKYNYELRRIKLAFNNLPASFKGLKIIQISDIHSGSFTDKNAVARGVEKVLAENADIILFTGDLVNNQAVEMEDYTDVFSRLKAPMGVFSVLGNHDYGDYFYGAHPTGLQAIEKENNLKRLKEMQASMGWRLLVNEHVALERNGEQIALIGIENWSAKARFPKYGKMKEAYAGAEKYPFKILMSHDPSHWDAQVRPDYPDVDLALAGHTHGMQFGVEIPGFKWSPVQYVYKQWAGLYEQGKQKLYVNRGYGFIGYPGRVGIMPEITVIELA